VRNSGATAVVEGVGDHGCEYMTGGEVVVLGRTGRNFGAGMSGGAAYVLDVDGSFHRRVNAEMVDLDPLDAEDRARVLELVRLHVEETDSAIGRRVLDPASGLADRFVKVMPTDFKRVLEARRAAEAAGTDPIAAIMAAAHG